MLFRLKVSCPDYNNPMIFIWDSGSDYEEDPRYQSLNSVLTDIQGVFSEECCIEVYPHESNIRLAVICGSEAYASYEKKCILDPEYFVG